MRTNKKALSATISLFLAAGAASGQAVDVDMDLGVVAPGQTFSISNTFAGVAAQGPMNIDLYAPNMTGTVTTPFVNTLDEFVVRFELTGPASLNAEQTGSTPFWTGPLVNGGYIMNNNLASNVFTFNTGAGAFRTFLLVGAGGGADVNQANRLADLPAGVYHFSFDPGVGFPPVEADGAGSMALDLAFIEQGPVSCSTGAFAAGIVEDFDLGVLTAGEFPISGTTVGAGADICGYRDLGGAGFIGFIADNSDLHYKFTIADAPETGYIIGVSQNEGRGVGTNQNHWLLDGTGVTPNFDLFGDGSTIGDIADEAVGDWVDEDSFDEGARQDGADDLPFGVFGNGEYWLAVDAFVFTATGGIDGPFDINLVISEGEPCSDEAPPAVDIDFGMVGPGSTLTVTQDTTAPGFENHFCDYFGINGSGLYQNGRDASGNEVISSFTLSGPALINSANFNTDGVDPNTDFFLVDDLMFEDAFAFPNGNEGRVADDIISLVTREGVFGVLDAGTYFVVSDGNAVGGAPVNGLHDFDIIISALPGGVSVFSPTIDPMSEATPLVGAGDIAGAFEPITLSTCMSAEDQDIIMAVFDADTGDLVAASNDNCGQGSGLPAINNLGLPEGNYILSISSAPRSEDIGSHAAVAAAGATAFNLFADGFQHDVRAAAQYDADTGVLDAVLDGTTLDVTAGLGGTVTASLPLSIPAFSRDVYSFSVGAPVAAPTATDLGTVLVDVEDNGDGTFDLTTTIDLCGSDAAFDSEVGFWTDEGAFIASNDDGANCSDFQSELTIIYATDDDNGNPDMLIPDLEGAKLFFSVSQFNTLFTGGFGATVDLTNTNPVYTGPYSGNINGVDISGDLSAGDEVDYYCFTLTAIDNPCGDGCNAADLAAPFNQFDIADVVTFLQLFGAMDECADLAAPMGALDIADVVTFLQLFGAGCP
ncbi:MAG: hypothetical protein CMJ31_10160 [Phycisphaerae bacterium]|nr:hypothetical protein [Phycisphaerae bacterium]